jgi:hypothetical protein
MSVVAPSVPSHTARPVEAWCQPAIAPSSLVMTRANRGRTATVAATTDMQLYTLEKDAFLAAVTGHAPTHALADRLVSDRLPADTAEPLGDD